MSAKQKTFIELLKSGRAQPADLDAFIAAWHKGDDSRDLHTAIGLTPAQYAKWVRGQAAIADFAPRSIKAARKLAYA